MEKISTQINQLEEIILNKLKALNKSFFVIAIDGDSSAGKTTFATKLAEKINANLVNIDDFYLPFDIREDCSSCHIDYQRCIETVLKVHQKQGTLQYYKFNPHQNRIEKKYQIPSKKVLILEGAYSFNPKLRPYVDLSIFFKIHDSLQKERIVRRSSEEIYEKFKNIWIPKEKTYQDETDLESDVNIIVYI